MSSDEEAQEMLGATREAGRRARRARQGYWFPLLVSGLLVAGATPFYLVQNPANYSPETGPLTIVGPNRPIFEGGGPPFQSGLAASVYWVIALTVGYGAVVFFYRLRARRIGVAGRIWPYVAVGLGLLALLAVLANSDALWLALPGAVRLPVVVLGIRGMMPLLIIAVGALVLAWSERSLSLTVFALCYAAVALVANLYDLGNLVDFPGPGMVTYASLPNLLAPAVVLLLGGLAFYVAQARRGGRPRPSARRLGSPEQFGPA